ncbi:MAG: peptidoglycan editing factor PgeF [Tissierellaceae bacterium]|nr:peptidoglycan editing factor PgeF [Tissierellaceae bacterium]
MNYRIIEKDNIRYILVPRLQELGLKHLFTTKDMDVGTRTNDSAESINNNINKIFDLLGVQPEVLYSGNQTHSKNIAIINDANEGQEYEFGRFFPETDGLITDKENIATITRFADCTPIVLIDTNKRVFANIHSGWKGTLQRIGANGVDMLIQNYNSDPKDIVAVIGPTIGRCDFEVDDDVAVQFKNEFGYMENIITKKDDIKSLIDLQTINKNMLLEHGLLIENIEVIELSTVASDFLHSYRRDKAEFGLMGSVAILSSK